MLDIQEPNSSLLYSVMKLQASLMISVRETMQRQWHTHIQEGLLSQLRMVTTTNWFRVQLVERLPFTKKLSFPTEDCLLPHKSAEDIFFTCALNSYREHRPGTVCLQGNKGNPMSLEIFLPYKKLTGLKYPMKLPWNLTHLSEFRRAHSFYTPGTLKWGD